MTGFRSAKRAKCLCESVRSLGERTDILADRPAARTTDGIRPLGKRAVSAACTGMSKSDPIDWVLSSVTPSAGATGDWTFMRLERGEAIVGRVENLCCDNSDKVSAPLVEADGDTATIDSSELPRACRRLNSAASGATVDTEDLWVRSLKVELASALS